MTDRFRLYPRGFLGDYANMPIVRKQDASIEVARELRGADTRPAQFKMIGAPNQALDSIYQSLVLTPSNMDRFAWREELLRVALKAFGTQSLLVWIKAQEKSAYCGRHHVNFINDCLRYVHCGEREQSISTWDMLIDDSDFEKGPTIATSNSGYAIGYKSITDATIPDLIKAWVSQEGGYSDMAISLRYLFGRYDGIY